MSDERITETAQAPAGDNRIGLLLAAVATIAAQLAEIHRRLLAATEQATAQAALKRNGHSR